MPDLTPFEGSSVEHLRLVIETGHIGIWELDVATGHAARNSRHDEIFGYDHLLDSWTYDRFLSHVAEEDRDRVDRLQQSAIANNSEWVFECRIDAADGVERWISAAGRPIANAEGEVVRLIGHVLDITEARQREARLSTLTDELNHRVRNMLAVVQSMIRLSRAQATDTDSFAQALEGRVGALVRSQQVFSDEIERSADPAHIIATELAAFPGFAERTAFEVRRQARVKGSACQGLSLVFHELITNAIKYGCFSDDNGSARVTIDGDENALRIEWKEQAGPPVRAPARSGFGSRLVASALAPQGSAQLAFEPDGVRCTIELKQR